MRITFMRSTEDFEAAARRAFPTAGFSPRACPARGQAVYVAYLPEHWETYERWFPGVTVRVRSRLQNQPLAPGGGMYLPVTYDSWVVAVDGPRGIGAALEAARVLQNVEVVMCPAFSNEDLSAVVESLSISYDRWQDRVFPQET